MTTLGDRMKEYERDSETETVVKPYLPYIVRLDGKNFSKYTRGFNKPFDNILITAMVRTMNDLVTEFNAKTGYTHSDEITLVFSEACSREEYESGEYKTVHLFNGRITKNLTILSGFCSARFNYHACNLLADNRRNIQVTNRIKDQRACFDARVLIFPYKQPQELVAHQIWRSVRDCNINAVEAYSRVYYSAKELHKKSVRDMIVMLKERGIDWETNIPLYIKHGVYGKKVLVEKEIEIDSVLSKCTRQQIYNFCLKITPTDESLNLLLAKDLPTNITIVPYINNSTIS